MSAFKYTDSEQELNKVLKMNLDKSEDMLTDESLNKSRAATDDSIQKTLELLHSLGKDADSQQIFMSTGNASTSPTLTNRPEISSWESILAQANEYVPRSVELEDIMSNQEIASAFQELDSINQEFSNKTGIINKIDLSFLAIATALQVTKAILFPYVAQQFGYGQSFDKANRLSHNDKSIEDSHRKSSDAFRDKNLEKYGTGYWINLLYQTPPYDITKGSASLGINMGGGYHRMYTLGHDPILGWIFGTMDILTDIITLNNFTSYRVTRTPSMRITPELVPLGILMKESYDIATAGKLNLPAAVVAEALHLKSDEFTKLGLPVPLLSSINEDFASKLYKQNYDALCVARDAKLVGASFVMSKIFDIIIALVHGLFRDESVDKDIFEVRTRKILLISNSIASTSTIINASITQNPKNLDIGSILNTVAHLFGDMRFMAKIKQEYVESEISQRLMKEIQETDILFNTL